MFDDKDDVYHLNTNTSSPVVGLRVLNEDSPNLETLIDRNDVVLFTKEWYHKPIGKPVVKMQLYVTDLACDYDPVYILVINSPAFEEALVCDPDFKMIAEREYTKDVEEYAVVSEVAETLPKPRLYSNSHVTDKGTKRTQRRHLPQDPREKLTCQHLDDIITQANIMKEVTTRIGAQDAYERMTFAMSKIQRLLDMNVYPVAAESFDQFWERNNESRRSAEDEYYRDTGRRGRYSG